MTNNDIKSQELIDNNETSDIEKIYSFDIETAKKDGGFDSWDTWSTDKNERIKQYLKAGLAVVAITLAGYFLIDYLPRLKNQMQQTQ